LELLRRPKQTLLGLLTENPAQYRQPISFKAQRHGYEQVKKNTEWFLRTYLLGHALKEVAGKAEERHEGKLGFLAGRRGVSTLGKAIGEEQIEI